VIEHILRATKLVEIDKTWVLIYNDKEYMRLLDAKSREDAEKQIAEMLFLSSGSQGTLSEPEESARPVATRNTLR
jgi:hypothetical protein